MTMNETHPTSPPAPDERSADRRARGRTGEGVLETFSIRNRTTGEQAARRAALMRRLRLVLPALAVVLIITFFANARRDAGDAAFLDDFANLEATTEGVKTARPHFSGVDAKGAPFDITAEAATQRPDGAQVYDLDQPRANTAGVDESSAVTANSGVYDQGAKRLDLGDGVVFNRSVGPDNYVLRTPAATVNVDDQTLISDKGVDGEGPGGAALKADRVTASNQDGKVVFEGNVSMRIYPKNEAAPPQAAERP